MLADLTKSAVCLLLNRISFRLISNELARSTHSFGRRVCGVASANAPAGAVCTNVARLTSLTDHFLAYGEKPTLI